VQQRLPNQRNWPESVNTLHNLLEFTSDARRTVRGIRATFKARLACALVAVIAFSAPVPDVSIHVRVNPPHIHRDAMLKLAPGVNKSLTLSRQLLNPLQGLRLFLLRCSCNAVKTQVGDRGDNVMVTEEKAKVLVLTGPTGVGKTELSLLLAERLNGEVVSADSVQVSTRQLLCVLYHMTL
jgi:hypothetical protein